LLLLSWLLTAQGISSTPPDLPNGIGPGKWLLDDRRAPISCKLALSLVTLSGGIVRCTLPDLPDLPGLPNRRAPISCKLVLGLVKVRNGECGICLGRVSLQQLKYLWVVVITVCGNGMMSKVYHLLRWCAFLFIYLFVFCLNVLRMLGRKPAAT